MKSVGRGSVKSSIQLNSQQRRTINRQTSTTSRIPLFSSTLTVRLSPLRQSKNSNPTNRCNNLVRSSSTTRSRYSQPLSVLSHNITHNHPFTNQINNINILKSRIVTNNGLHTNNGNNYSRNGAITANGQSYRDYNSIVVVSKRFQSATVAGSPIAKNTSSASNTATAATSNTTISTTAPIPPSTNTASAVASKSQRRKAAKNGYPGASNIGTSEQRKAWTVTQYNTQISQAWEFLNSKYPHRYDNRNAAYGVNSQGKNVENDSPVSYNPTIVNTNQIIADLFVELWDKVHKSGKYSDLDPTILHLSFTVLCDLYKNYIPWKIAETLTAKLASDKELLGKLLNNDTLILLTMRGFASDAPLPHTQLHFNLTHNPNTLIYFNPHQNNKNKKEHDKIYQEKIYPKKDSHDWKTVVAKEVLLSRTE